MTLVAPTNAPVWDPADYVANSAAQHSWAQELIAKLNLKGHERILDVGCGDGRVTAQLAKALSSGTATGVDSSEEMLRFARAAFPASNHPNLRFVQQDARQLDFDEPFDVLVSNAALHWVDDHPAFLRRAAHCLKAGGRLVISCGGKGNARDVFVALRKTIRLQRWRDYFRDLAAPYFFHSPEEYEQWLPATGFEPRVVRLANKDTCFHGPANLTAWLRTTWLPYTQRVPAPQRDAFISDIVERYTARNPADESARVTVRMVRLEIDAVRK